MVELILHESSFTLLYNDIPVTNVVRVCFVILKIWLIVFQSQWTLNFHFTNCERNFLIVDATFQLLTVSNNWKWNWYYPSNDLGIAVRKSFEAIWDQKRTFSTRVYFPKTLYLNFGSRCVVYLVCHLTKVGLSCGCFMSSPFWSHTVSLKTCYLLQVHDRLLMRAKPKVNNVRYAPSHKGLSLKHITCCKIRFTCWCVRN